MKQVIRCLPLLSPLLGRGGGRVGGVVGGITCRPWNLQPCAGLESHTLPPHPHPTPRAASRKPLRPDTTHKKDGNKKIVSLNCKKKPTFGEPLMTLRYDGSKAGEIRETASGRGPKNAFYRSKTPQNHFFPTKLDSPLAPPPPPPPQQLNECRPGRCCMSDIVASRPDGRNPT